MWNLLLALLMTLPALAADEDGGEKPTELRPVDWSYGRLTFEKTNGFLQYVDKDGNRYTFNDLFVREAKTTKEFPNRVENISRWEINAPLARRDIKAIKTQRGEKDPLLVIRKSYGRGYDRLPPDADVPGWDRIKSSKDAQKYIEENKSVEGADAPDVSWKIAEEEIRFNFGRERIPPEWVHSRSLSEILDDVGSPLLRLPKVLDQDGFFPGIKIIEREVEPGVSLLYWVFSSYSVVDRTKAEVRMHYVVKSGNHLEMHHSAGRTVFFKTFDLEYEPDQVGHLYGVRYGDDLVFYDQNEGVLFLKDIKFNGVEDNKEVPRSVYKIDTDSLRVPKIFSAGKTIAESGGKLLLESNGVLHLFDADGGELLLGKARTVGPPIEGPTVKTTTEPVTEAVDGQVTILDELKKQRLDAINVRRQNRKEWMYGADDVSRFLLGQLETGEGKKSRLSVEGSVEEWIGERVVKASTSINGVVDEDLPHEDYLFNFISPDLIRSYQKIRPQIHQQVVNVFRQYEKGQKATEIIYLPLSSNGPQRDHIWDEVHSHGGLNQSFGGTLKSIIAAIHKKHQDPNAVRVLLVVDALNIGLWSKENVRNLARMVKGSGIHDFSEAMVSVLLNSNGKAPVVEYFTSEEKGRVAGDDTPAIIRYENWIDGQVLETEFVTAVSARLKSKRMTVSSKIIATVIAEIRKENAEWSPKTTSITQFSDEIYKILKHGRLDFSKPSLGVDIAKIHNQLVGARNIQIDKNLKDRVDALYDRITVSGANPVRDPLFMRDPHIKAIQHHIKKRISHRSVRFVPIYLWGPQGTGKTVAAKMIMEQLGATYATIPMNVLKKPEENAQLDLSPITDAYDSLLMKSTGLKGLIFEEADKNPSIFPYLMQALDQEVTGSRAIDLRGTIVVITSNLLTEPDGYDQFVKMTMDSKGFEQKNQEMFVRALSKDESQRLNIMEPLAGRMFGGIFFFGPFGSPNKDDLSTIVNHLIKNFELDNNLRLIVREEADDRLKNILMEHAHSNFRGSLDAVISELNVALKNLLAEKGRKELSGRFVLSLADTGNDANSLRLDPPSNSPTVVEGMVTNYYADYLMTLELAARDVVGVLDEQIKLHGDVDAVSHTRKNFSRVIESFSKLQKVSLFKKGVGPSKETTVRIFDKVPSIKVNSEQLHSVLKEMTRPAFEMVVSADGKLSENLPQQLLHQLQQDIYFLTVRLDQYYRAEPREFARWATTTVKSVEAVVGDFFVQPSDISFNSQLAAVILAEYGRQMAHDKFAEIIPDAWKKATSKARVDVSSPTPEVKDTPEEELTRSEQCQELLQRFSAAKARLKK